MAHEEQQRTLPPPPQATRSYDILEAARGVSALFVVVSHARAFAINDYGHGTTSLFSKIFYLLTGLGHQAVVVFFVLSGFLITGSVSRSVAKKTWSWRSYLAARLGRLHAVAIPCLLLTLAIDWGTISATHSPFYTGQLSYSGSAPAGGAHLDWLTLLGNVFFLQTIFTPVLGSNGPLWSLANEFWYYIIFPLTLAVIPYALTQKYRIDLLAAVAITAFGLLAHIPILALYGVWYAGRLSRQLSDAGALRRYNLIWVAASALALLAGLAVARSKVLPPETSDLMLAAPLSLLFAATAEVKIPSALFPPFHFLARISYSVYLIHFPVMASICAFVLANQRQNLSAQSALTTLGLCVAGVGAGWLVHTFFERRTDSVRRLFGRAMGL